MNGRPGARAKRGESCWVDGLWHTRARSAAAIHLCWVECEHVPVERPREGGAARSNQEPDSCCLLDFASFEPSALSTLSKCGAAWSRALNSKTRQAVKCS